MKYLLLIPFLVVGCATTPVAEKSPPIPVDLLQDCPDLSPLEDDSAGALLKKLIEIAGLYHECQANHHSLIGAVKDGKRNP